MRCCVILVFECVCLSACVVACLRVCVCLFGCVCARVCLLSLRVMTVCCVAGVLPCWFAGLLLCCCVPVSSVYCFVV